MKNGTRKWLFCAVLVVLLAGLTGMAAAKELLIGNMQDISGPTSVWGNAVTRGAEIAIEKINAAGGIDGAMLKLVTMDTKANVQEAIKGYNSLVSSGVVAVVGPPVSNIGLALGPIANKAGVPVVGSFIDPRVTVGEDGKPHAAMFLMQPSSIQYSEIMASYTIDVLGLKKVGVLYDQSNAFAVSLMKPYVDYIKAAGGEIVSEQVYTKGDKDFKTQLLKIKDAGADCLYFPNYIQDAVLAMNQRKQVGLDVPVIGGLDFAPPFASLVNDPEATNDIYLANNFSETEPQLKEVWEIYKTKYGEDPVNKVFLGYDKVLLIREAMKLGGGTSAAQVMAGLSQVKELQGTTGVLTISPETHQPVGLSMVMYKIEKGKYVELGRYVPEKHK
ncbi:MAG TPA: ABC transporter substrate-binding protein [Aminobacteriaceae bacterium]|nr:ABC transporter substrate-binding protein [Aminobacteriaceae bacterium]